MNAYLQMPFAVLHFWYVEAPREILEYFFSLNTAFGEFFSIPLLLRTFFKPLKNEYREGLVGFSRGFGIVVKSALLVLSGVLFLLLLLGELCVFFGFLAFPLFAIIFLFK